MGFLRGADNQYMEKVRNKWIDIAKGITIILMVLGHSSLPQSISNFIWSFHMPFFFIVSGLMTNFDSYSFMQFVKRKVKNLLIPFFCYSAISMLWIEMIDGGGFVIWLINGWGGYALWFVPVLFLSLIIARTLIMCRKYMIFLLVCTISLSCFLCYHSIIFPWSLSTVPYAIFLVLAGNYFKRFLQYMDRPKNNLWCLMLLFCTATSIIISQYWRLDLCCNQILPIMPLTIAAFAGTIMVFLLSKYIEIYMRTISDALQSVGKETFIIVAFSQIIIMTINKYITHSVPLKYSMLVVLLVTIKYGKDFVVKIIKTK